MAGLGLLLLATQSVIGAYDTTLFTVHMTQHLLLTMVAAPLLLLGAPVTLLLRASSTEVRKRWILPVLHSRVVRTLSNPFVAWTLFAVVMWTSHFSPLFDAALEDPFIHELEHLLYLATALLFWWPVVGVDPAPRRLSHPMRVGYLMVGMPFSSFLGLAIFSATSVLYAHYATLAADVGPDTARRPVMGGRHHVGRRRPRVPRRDGPRRDRPGCGRRRRRGAGWTRCSTTRRPRPPRPRRAPPRPRRPPGRRRPGAAPCASSRRPESAPSQERS